MTTTTSQRMNTIQNSMMQYRTNVRVAEEGEAGGGAGAEDGVGVADEDAPQQRQRVVLVRSVQRHHRQRDEQRRACGLVGADVVGAPNLAGSFRGALRK